MFREDSGDHGLQETRVAALLVPDAGLSQIEIVVEIAGAYMSNDQNSSTSGKAEEELAEHAAVLGGVVVEWSVSQPGIGSIEHPDNDAWEIEELTYHYASYKATPGLHNLEKTHRVSSRGDDALPCREGLSLVGWDDQWGELIVCPVQLDEFDPKRPIRCDFWIERYSPDEHGEDELPGLPDWAKDAEPESYGLDQSEDDEPLEEWMHPVIIGASIWEGS
ncbi:MAG: hypothetical protein ACOCV2_02255 [Persicimonas sp.]